MERENKMSKELLERSLEEVSFVVFDTETSLKSRSGQPAFYDMVEIGGIFFNLKGQGIDSFHSFVKPYYPFNRASCKAMHITEEVLATAPIFPEVIDSIANLFTNRVVVGQNTQFDVRTIKHALELYGTMGQINSGLQTQLLSTLELPFLDTKKIFAQLFLSEKQKSLDTIALKVGISPERTKHSALEDARLTMEVFKRLIELLRPKNVVTLGHLFDFQEGQHGKAKQTSFL